MQQTARSLEAHPVAEIFPLMTGREFEELKADILAHGLIEPIWTFDGRIIDGRNRHRACAELGVEPDFREWDGDESELPAFVASLNLHRRHLDASQRAMVGARLKEYYAAEARKRQRGGQGGVLLPANLPEAKGDAREKAAGAVNVSPRLVDHAANVLRNGVPDLVGAVERGEVKASAAAAVASLPAESQREVIARGPAAVRDVARDLRAARPTPPAVAEEGEEDEGEDEAGPGPEPAPAPDPAGEAWAKLLGDYARLANSIRRRGGVVELFRRFSPDRRAMAIEALEDIRDTFASYASEARRELT